MKTLALEKPGQWRLYETEVPGAPGPNEALIRVHRVGICGTDINAYHGRQPFFNYPRITGHELGVEIAEIGPNEHGLKVGDRCSVEPYLNCGTCIACRNGKTNCCVTLKCLGVHCDGGMREFITIPINKLHPSKLLSFEQLALVETLGIGAHAVQRAALRKDEFVLVIGAGPIGLSVVQFAQVAGARVIVLDVNENRLKFCESQFKPQHVLLDGPQALETIGAITHGELPTAVFDATGNHASMQRAFQFVTHGGRLVFVGIIQGDVSFSDPEFHRHEWTILATRNATSGDFRNIIGLMERGEIDTTPWITHRVSCCDMPSVFANWLAPGSGLIKGMVEF
jgi:2-desacetyl-2-hydroxyethyl bacteriochlorophyllide A dehydrogenase